MLSEVRQSSRPAGGPELSMLNVHSDAGNYVDTWDAFALDFGQPLPPLPSGSAVMRIYTPGVRNDLTDAGGNVLWSDSLPWDFGDQILASVKPMLQAQYARLVPAVGLSQAKAASASQLRGECEAAISGGFASSALGEPHFYPSTPQARTDLNASVTASLLPDVPAGWTTPFWCSDQTGARALRDHTAAQIQQVGKDCKAMVDAAEAKLAQLYANLEKAQTTKDAEYVVWR